MFSHHSNNRSQEPRKQQQPIEYLTEKLSKIKCQNKTDTKPISQPKTNGFYSYFLAKELYNHSVIESTL
jgi:hypothetical protein